MRRLKITLLKIWYNVPGLRFIVILLACFGLFYYVFLAGQRPPVSSYDVPIVNHHIHQVATVEIYTLSYCGYCHLMMRQMRQAGIRYVEYQIDTDRNRMNELSNRLIAAGRKPGGSMPITFAGKQIFVGMAKMSDIESAVE